MIYKGEIPFVRILIPFVLGIFLAWYFPDNQLRSIAVQVTLGLMTILFLGLLYYKKYHIYLLKQYLGVLVHAILIFLAYLFTCSHIPGLELNYFAKFKSKSLLLTVNSEPTLRNDILRFEAAVRYADRNEVDGNLLIALKIDTASKFNLRYGDLLITPANFHPVEPPYNPHEFDFQYFLKTRKIHYQSFINQQEIRKLGGGYGNQVLSLALELRRTIVNHFKIHIRGHEAAALASTLIMGYRADLSPEILSAYSKTGTMHVLSVSGMHVALLFVMFAFLLKPLERIQKLRVLQLFILITLVWFYALLTGFSPSVNRAALMLSFVVLGKAVYKSMNTYNLLAISAFILLLYNPLYLFDIGFQLSYLAVFGLIFIHPMIYQSFYIKNKLLDAIWSYTALSIAAQTITAPLSMYIFHQFPLYFLMSNLIIVLPVSLIMYLGVGFVLLLPFGLFLPFTGEVLHHLIQSTNSMLQYVEHLPFSSVDGIWINSFQLILIYLIVFAVFFTLIYKSKKFLFTTLIATVLLLLSTNLRQVEIKRKQEIIFFSLRKNTAIAYISGKEVFLVTDLEKEDKAYQFSIYPALSQSGLKIKAWLNPGADYYSSDFCQQNNRMQFAALKVFRWSSALNYQLFDRIIETDIILLSGNPVIRLKDLVQKANFSQLLIDGTNPDYKIKKWMEEARTLAIPLHVLKKNKAWIQEISVNKPQ